MELAPDKNPELIISVSDPKRHIDPIKDYVSYALDTRTTLSSFPAASFSVRRRYNHFLEFRDQLVLHFPGVVVPPLPEKMTTKYLDRFSDTFLEKRRRALEQFMNRLTVHPQLSQSDQLRHFLVEENWIRVDDDKNLATNSAWMKMSLTGLRNKTKNDPDGNSFENLKNYFIEFHKTLTSIHALLASVCRKHVELGELYTSLGESFLALAEQPERSLEEAIRTLGQVYGQKQSSLLNESATQLDYNTVESLKEYVLIGQTALTVLKYRDGPLAGYLSALSDLTETKAELLRLQKQQEEPSSAKRSTFGSFFSEDPSVKINKLQERVSTEEGRLTTTREVLESVSKALIAEMERLHQYKLKDLRNLLIEFVNGQIELHKKSAENWEASLSIISSISMSMMNDEVPPSASFVDQSTTSSIAAVASSSSVSSSSSPGGLGGDHQQQQQHQQYLFQDDNDLYQQQQQQQSSTQQQQQHHHEDVYQQQPPPQQQQPPSSSSSSSSWSMYGDGRDTSNYSEYHEQPPPVPQTYVDSRDDGTTPVDLDD